MAGINSLAGGDGLTNQQRYQQRQADKKARLDARNAHNAALDANRPDGVSRGVWERATTGNLDGFNLANVTNNYDTRDALVNAGYGDFVKQAHEQAIQDRAAHYGGNGASSADAMNTAQLGWYTDQYGEFKGPQQEQQKPDHHQQMDAMNTRLAEELAPNKGAGMLAMGKPSMQSAMNSTKGGAPVVDNQNQISNVKPAAGMMGPTSSAMQDYANTVNSMPEYDGSTPNWDGTEEQAQENYDFSPQMAEAFGSFENYLAYLEEYEAARAGAVNANNQNTVNDPLANEVADAGGLMQWAGAQAAAGNDPGAALDGSYLTQSQDSLQQVNQALWDKYTTGDVSMDSYTDENGDKYHWNGTGFTRYEQGSDEGWDLFTGLATAAAGGVIGSGLAGALAPALGVTNSVGTGALQGGLSSAVNGAVNGNLSVEGIIQGAITGGIGSLASEVANGAIAGTQLDNAIWDLSGSMGLSFEETANILGNVASGVVNGEDIETILTGAVASWATPTLSGALADQIGDEFDVTNLFKDGVTTLPTESLNPFIETGVEALLQGEIDGTDVGGAFIDYLREGGNVDFLLPNMPDIDWPNLDLPDLEALEFNFPDIDWPNLNIDFPELDLPDLSGLPWPSIGGGVFSGLTLPRH